MSSRSPSPARRDGSRPLRPSGSRSPPPAIPRSEHSRSGSPSMDRRGSHDRALRGRSPHRNGRHRSRSYSRSRSRSRDRDRSFSRSRSRTRSRSFSRDGSYSRDRSPTRSVSHSRSAHRSTKIVVERLTKNVNEDHLREIFGQYGQIEDLDLPVNRQFGTNRGTAYILFVHESEAEAAIAHMHEAQLDGATINVSIVLPRRKFSPAPPTARRGAGYDPRNPPPAFRPGPAGPPFGSGGPPAGRPPQNPRGYGPRSDTYRPQSASGSRSRSPVVGGGGSRRYRSRSRSYSSRSRSPSRGSYNSYDRRSRSRSHSRRRERERR